MTDAPWFRLNVDYWRNPKVTQAGLLGAALHLAAIGYAAEQLTDGFIPTYAAKILAAPMHGWVWVGEDGARVTARDVADSRWMSLASDLVEAGLWQEVPGGWVIVNYLEHQDSREQVEARKAQAREAGRRGGLNRAAKRSAKPVASDPPSDPPSGRSSGPSSGIQAQAPTPTERPLPPTVVAPSAVAEATFDAWWDAYPRKVGKRTARTAWDRACQRIAPDVILTATELFRDDPNREAVFTPHPATWLNRDGWFDDACQPRNPRPNKAEERDRRHLALIEHFSPDKQGEIA